MTQKSKTTKEILTEAQGPADWMPLFNSIENQQRAWSGGASRTAWTQDA